MFKVLITKLDPTSLKQSASKSSRSKSNAKVKSMLAFYQEQQGRGSKLSPAKRKASSRDDFQDEDNSQRVSKISAYQSGRYSPADLTHSSTARGEETLLITPSQTIPMASMALSSGSGGTNSFRSHPNSMSPTFGAATTMLDSHNCSGGSGREGEMLDRIEGAKKSKKAKRLRSRNQVVDEWLADDQEKQDDYADLEDFIV
jgi:hypothetical protein